MYFKQLMVMLTLSMPNWLFGIEMTEIPEPTQEQVENAYLSEAIDPLTGIADKVIIGAESRRRFNSSKYPWIAVGKIKFGEDAGYVCTANLVGPRHIVTNAHCTDYDHPIYFYPSYNNGRYRDRTPRVTWATRAYRGTTNDHTSDDFDWGEDWAILVLNERTGPEFGWFGVRRFASSWFGHRYWTMVSYPLAGSLNDNGEYPVYEARGVVAERSGKNLLHKMDAHGGASGSGIFSFWEDKGYYIVALHNFSRGRVDNCRYNRRTCASGAVDARYFVDKLSRVRTQYP